MAIYFRILFLSFGIWLVGCTQIPNELKIAQEMLEMKPDSALYILQKIKSDHYKSKSSRALYGLLLFQALDRNNQTLQPDSVLDFSVNYYQQKNQKHELAIGYIYKARIHKKAQRFDQASTLYICALDILQNTEDYYFLGKIHSDLGDICGFQKDYNESLQKYQLALSYFQKANDTIEACYKLVDIGRSYRFLKVPKKALQYYTKAINQSSDSLVHGSAYQEIGVFYYKTEKYDSAIYYLNKSFRYPYKGNGYAIRCYVIAQVYYESNQLDSAMYYAKLAFNYPTTFYLQRDCNRILANSEYNRGNFEKAGVYLGKYQDCADSIRIIESQTKSTVL